MNRNDEFTEFMKELDGGVPEIGESIKRGSRRKARKKFLYQPLMGLTAVFMLFVLSVNISAPVAKAFSNVPFLKDLTNSVIFSKSLRDAIENDYVQGVELKQTKNGVTAEIISMVVDQEKLTVFYRFESDKYKNLIASRKVYDERGEDELGFTENEMSSFGCQNEQIRSVSTDYLMLNRADNIWMESMPEKVTFRMTVWDRQIFGDKNYLSDELIQKDSEHILTFDFLLDLSPENMAQPMVYEVNQTIEIEEHKLTVKDVQVYPTYMQVHVEDAAENESPLQFLHYYVENEDGERFYNFGNMVKTNSMDSNASMFFRFEGESPYFTDSESLKLVVTGAEWLEPEKECTFVNLVTGEVKNLPEYVTLKEIKELNGMTYLTFSQECVAMADERTGERIDRRRSGDPFVGWYYDGEEKKHETTYEGLDPKEALEWDLIQYGRMERDESDNLTGIYNCTFELKDYPYEEIRLVNFYSDAWRAEEEVSIVIK